MFGLRYLSHPSEDNIRGTIGRPSTEWPPIRSIQQAIRLQPKPKGTSSSTNFRGCPSSDWVGTWENIWRSSCALWRILVPFLDKPDIRCLNDRFAWNNVHTPRQSRSPLVIYTIHVNMIIAMLFLSIWHLNWLIDGFSLIIGLVRPSVNGDTVDRYYMHGLSCSYASLKLVRLSWFQIRYEGAETKENKSTRHSASIDVTVCVKDCVGWKSLLCATWICGLFLEMQDCHRVNAWKPTPTNISCIYSFIFLLALY
jgi:hypothetical protein